jgi:hypothetical protein
MSWTLAAERPPFRSADVDGPDAKDMMVWLELDGGIYDEIRLAAVADIARWLDAQVVTGLFLNVFATTRSDRGGHHGRGCTRQKRS